MSDAYSAAGVDTAAGERAVELMRAAVARATRPEVQGDLGGFAGLFDASALATYRRPLLATATDGVGTKVAVAQAMDIHHTIGIDLVAMVVDDIVVCGERPRAVASPAQPSRPPVAAAPAPVAPADVYDEDIPF